MKLLILLFIFSINIKAGPSEVRFFGQKRHVFNFKEVCSVLGDKFSIITKDLSMRLLDCMGTRVDIHKFCADKYADKGDYARGYIDRKEKKVVCQRAHRISIATDCKGKIACLDDIQKEKSCLFLKQYYAAKLKLDHYSTINKKLNCYFLSQSELK